MGDIDSDFEGWTWTHGARKWHYYRSLRAICGGTLMLAHPSEGYQLGNDNSPDNCASCRRRLTAEASKQRAQASQEQANKEQP